MAPPKEDNPGKGNKPAKPKPTSLPQFSINEMPPAENHENKLVSVVNESGEVLSLAYSNGDVWLQIAIAGELAIPTPGTPAAEPAPQPEPPPTPAPVEPPPPQPATTPAQSPAPVETPTYAPAEPAQTAAQPQQPQQSSPPAPAPAQAPAPEPPAGTVVPPNVPPSAETGGAT